MIYRYLVGTCGGYGIDPLFQFDSPSKMDDAAVLSRLHEAIGKAGFKHLDRKDANLIVESHEVRQFRRQEFELPEWYGVVGLDQALEGIQPGEVLVIAYTSSYNSGQDYGFLLLAMPKDSRVLRHYSYRDPGMICTEEVNRWLAFDDQMPGRRVCLPSNTRLWDSQIQQWISKNELVYGVPDGNDYDDQVEKAWALHEAGENTD